MNLLRLRMWFKYRHFRTVQSMRANRKERQRLRDERWIRLLRNMNEEKQ